MGGEIDLCRKLLASKIRVVVMAQQLRPSNYFVYEIRQRCFDILQRLAPVVGKGKNGHRLIRLRAQVMTELFNEFRIDKREYLVCGNSGRFSQIVTRVRR